MSLHNAPPVVYPLGRSHLLGALLLGLWCAGLLSVLLWYRLTLSFNWRLLAGLAGVLAAGLAAASSWKNAPSGQLAWDGEVWRWHSVREPAGLAAQEVSRELAGFAAQEGARERASLAERVVAHEPAHLVSRQPQSVGTPASASDQLGRLDTTLAAQDVSVIADFQRCLLLKLKNQGGARLWLWVEERAMPARWLDLRRAVYSPRRSSNAAQAHDVLAAQPALSRTLSASAVLTVSASSAVSTAPAASAVAISTARPSMEAARLQP